MSALQTQPNAVEVRMQDLSPQYAEIMVLGKVLQMSGYFKDVRDQAQAVTKILFGRELGISPINSMSAIHIIEGKPTLSANLLAALIKRSGKYDYRVKVWTDKKCVLIFKQKIDDNVWEEVGESEFTIDDATRAGVVRAGGGWTKYPKAMLFARALSQGERTYCPDVSVSPLYVPEELGAEVNEAGEVLKPETVAPKQVERTTAPIPISRNPVTVAAPAPVKGEEKIADQPQGVPSSAPERQPGEDDDVVDFTALADALTHAGKDSVATETAVKAAKAVAKKPEFIDGGRQTNFAIEFRNALPAKFSNAETEKLRHDWLGAHFFMDSDGNPSSKGIKVSEFERVKKEACAWARAQK